MSRPRGLNAGGFGLIEVAISLLVLSIGVLGLAQLQITAKRVGFEAIQRTGAAAMALDLFERMRVNRVALQHYQTSGVGAASGSQLAVPARNCRSDSCTPGQLSVWDLWQWERALDGAATAGNAGGLVHPLGCVNVSGRLVTVEIAWGGFRPLSAGTVATDCGSGLYGPDDVRRQLLQITSYVGED